jgi:hypothetical protein
MTESQWLACTDAKAMLEFVRGRTSDRKMRLFAVACCRQLWRSAVQEGQAALEIAELYADGGCDEDRREAAATESRLAHSSACYFLDVFLGAVLTVETDATKAASRAVTFDWSGYRPREWEQFLPLIRHFFNSFQPGNS